jgi:hypothetical protein
LQNAPFLGIQNLLFSNLLSVVHNLFYVDKEIEEIDVHVCARETKLGEATINALDVTLTKKKKW